MTFHQLFPDIIYQTHVDDFELIKKKFANKIIHKFKHDPNEQAEWATLSNTWQVNANQELKDLYWVYFDQHVIKWLQFYNFPPLKYDVDMWINVHTSEMYQDYHDHIGHNVILCGNYNLLLHKKDRSLTFRSPREYTKMLESFGITITNPIASPFSEAVLNIKEGDLVLFAPTQGHQVSCAKEKHDGHRITISFNVRSSS